MRKNAAAETVRDVTPELPKESPANKSDAPAVTSASKWQVKVSSTSVPKSQLSVVKTSVPKWVLAETVSSTVNTLNGLKPRGRKGIPVTVVRQVWERDDYCCVNELNEGKRCASKIGLQVDHVRPVSFGQDNRLENLRLLCRQCNIASAEEILGTAVMERYRWIKSRKAEEAAY